MKFKRVGEKKRVVEEKRKDGYIGSFGQALGMMFQLTTKYLKLKSELDD